MCTIFALNLNKGTFSRAEVTTWDLADEGQPVIVRVLAMIVLEVKILKMRRTSINLAYWNINCLKSKLFDNKSNDSEFLKEISCFDILCLSEIKCNMDNVNFEVTVLMFCN